MGKALRGNVKGKKGKVTTKGLSYHPNECMAKGGGGCLLQNCAIIGCLPRQPYVLSVGNQDHCTDYRVVAGITVWILSCYILKREVNVFFVCKTGLPYFFLFPARKKKTLNHCIAFSVVGVCYGNYALLWKRHIPYISSANCNLFLLFVFNWTTESFCASHDSSILVLYLPCSFVKRKVNIYFASRPWLLSSCPLFG